MPVERTRAERGETSLSAECVRADWLRDRLDDVRSELSDAQHVLSAARNELTVAQNAQAEAQDLGLKLVHKARRR